MEDGVVIQVFLGYHRLDDMLHQVLVDFVIGHICRGKGHAKSERRSIVWDVSQALQQQGEQCNAPVRVAASTASKHLAGAVMLCSLRSRGQHLLLQAQPLTTLDKAGLHLQHQLHACAQGASLCSLPPTGKPCEGLSPRTWGVLGGDQDGVHTQGHHGTALVLVLHSHLQGRQALVSGLMGSKAPAVPISFVKKIDAAAGSGMSSTG